MQLADLCTRTTTLMSYTQPYKTRVLLIIPALTRADTMKIVEPKLNSAQNHNTNTGNLPATAVNQSEG